MAGSFSCHDAWNAYETVSRAPRLLCNECLYNMKSLKDLLHLGSDLGLVGDFVHAKRADLIGFLSPLDTEAAAWIQDELCPYLSVEKWTCL